MKYDRNRSLEYAKKWAYSRNPQYYNYDKIGGDCTNFASQCLFAGSKRMNYQKNGWYYKDANNKSPSWTGVEYFYNFLINNKTVGPYGETVNVQKLEEGDFIQLSFDGVKFSHTLVVIKKQNITDEILVATHTFDSYGRTLKSYKYQKIRYIHIEGVR